jgi:phosphoheptose isomerase
VEDYNFQTLFEREVGQHGIRSYGNFGISTERNQKNDSGS